MDPATRRATEREQMNAAQVKARNAIIRTEALPGSQFGIKIRSIDNARIAWNPVTLKWEES